MATNKNITMRQFNGTDYDTLYPKTKVEQVEGAYTQQQILADSTKTMFGLGTDAVPDDMWVNLVPVGGILWYAKDGIPDGYLKCDGSVISRIDYERLFSVIGTVFGQGNGNTTFSLPDLRARFIRSPGIIGSDNISFGSTDNGSYVNYTTVGYSGNTMTISSLDNRTSFSGRALESTTYNEEITYFRGYIRPRNIALTPIIKY